MKISNLHFRPTGKLAPFSPLAPCCAHSLAEGVATLVGMQMIGRMANVETMRTILEAIDPVLQCGEPLAGHLCPSLCLEDAEIGRILSMANEYRAAL